MKGHFFSPLILSLADGEGSLTISARCKAGTDQRYFASLNMTIRKGSVSGVLRLS
jgi:hypothetical protein